MSPLQNAAWGECCLVVFPLPLDRAKFGLNYCVEVTIDWTTDPPCVNLIACQSRNSD